MEAEKLKELEILSEETFLTLFELESEVERVELLEQLENRAKELKVLQAFKRKYKAYVKDNQEINKYTSVLDNPFDLDVNKDGAFIPSINNFVRILEHDLEYKGKIRLNEMSNVTEFNGEAFTDTNDSEIRLYIENKYKIFNEKKLYDAIKVVSKRNLYNPIKEKIESIVWDGNSRIKTMLVKWMLTEKSEYVQEVSRLIFAGGIHRLYEPGCKFDEMPVLVGTSQGEGKSTFVRLLAMDDKYFNEIKDIEGVKGIEALLGYWICEMGELLALTKAKEVEAVKAYITCKSDNYRKPYARHVSTNPRRCIMIGTTNNENFLTDKTGNRRFYPVTVHSKAKYLFDNRKELKNDIEQCWAEALHLYKQDPKQEAIQPFLRNELVNVVKERQENSMQEDYRQGMIETYLEYKNQACVIELWHNALKNNENSKPSRKDSQEIALMILRIDGWTKFLDDNGIWKTRYFKDFGKQKAFIKVDLPF